MANTVDIQTIVDGKKNLVIKIYMASDGAAGDITDQVIVDFSALSNDPNNLRLLTLQSSLTGFVIDLQWDADVDANLFHVPAGHIEHDFRTFGGIPNPQATGNTGDVLLNTTGFAASGDNGTITLTFAKN